MKNVIPDLNTFINEGKVEQVMKKIVTEYPFPSGTKTNKEAQTPVMCGYDSEDEMHIVMQHNVDAQLYPSFKMVKLPIGTLLKGHTTKEFNGTRNVLFTLYGTKEKLYFLDWNPSNTVIGLYKGTKK